MKAKILSEVIEAVQRAEDKHPFFAENPQHAVSLAAEELGEMAKAVNDGNIEDAHAEALNTIAVLVRMVEMIEEQGYGTPSTH